MILEHFPAGTLLYRAHTPEWAGLPLSGAGAARKGGRFNREGVEALYLALDEITALREYQQTSPFLPPCTMCSYTAPWSISSTFANWLMAIRGMNSGIAGRRIGGT